MKPKLSIAASLALLLLAGLACQTGQILTPEEATQSALATSQAGIAEAGEAIGAELSVGDQVELKGSSFLVPIFHQPGSADAVTHVARGDAGTITASASVDDTIWYQVETDGGTGWVAETALEPTGESSAAGGGVEAQFENGQTAYLQGVQYLIGIMDAPGSNTMAAAQERGVEVTVLEARSVEGEVWYRIKAPTGEGWVPEANLSAEPPSS